VNVKNNDGTTTEWMIEGATPNTLLRRGFTRDTVKTGTEITVVGYQAKNGAPRANKQPAKSCPSTRPHASSLRNFSPCTR